MLMSTYLNTIHYINVFNYNTCRVAVVCISCTKEMILFLLLALFGRR